MENGILDNEQIKKLFLYFTFEPVVPKTVFIYSILIQIGRKQRASSNR